jgi:hypothetical protein
MEYVLYVRRRRTSSLLNVRHPTKERKINKRWLVNLIERLENGFSTYLRNFRDLHCLDWLIPNCEFILVECSNISFKFQRTRFPGCRGVEVLCHRRRISGIIEKDEINLKTIPLSSSFSFEPVFSSLKSPVSFNYFCHIKFYRRDQ